MKRSFFLFLILFAIHRPACGQGDFDKGFLPNGGYHVSDFDSVNLANGNLILNVPLLSYPQRGSLPDLQIFVGANSAVWNPMPQGQYLYYWANSQSNQAIPYVTSSAAVGIGITSYRYYDGYNTYHSYHSVDAWKAHHVWGTASPTSSVTIDGFLTANGVGSQIKPPLLDPNGNCFGGTCDPSGNTITYSPSSNAYTDSIGRVIPGSPSGIGCQTLNYPGIGNGTVPIKFCFGAAQQFWSNFHISGINEGQTLTEYPLQAITLPNGTTWSFTYDSWGDIQTVTVPTGATISYTYTNVSTCDSVNNAPSTPLIRSIASRSVDLHDGSSAKTWKYNYIILGGSGHQTVVTDPANNDTVHTFGILGCVPAETETQYYSGLYTGNGLLKTVDVAYSSGVTNPYDYIDNDFAVVGMFPLSRTTTWKNGEVIKETYTYDSAGGLTYYDSNNGNVGPPFYAVSYGDVLTKNEYDYGTNPSSLPLLRQTSYQYLWQTNSQYAATNVHMVTRPSSVTIFDGYGKQMGLTSYGYDENNGSPQGLYGNQTSVTRWLNGGTSPVTSTVYNTQGMAAKKIDANGNTLKITYDSTGLFPNQFQYPDTVSGGVTYHHYEYPTYDSNTGLLLSNKDQNSQITQYGYDSMRRLTSVSYPDGGSESFIYSDTTPNPSFKYTEAITSGVNLVKIGTLDGFGREIQTALTSDPDGTTYTAKTYDSLGRMSNGYNPTRCNPPTTKCNNESTWGYSTYNYDPLSRVTSIVEQDSSVSSRDYSALPCTTVTDEAGTSRKSCVDGIGRVTKVLEDPGTSPHLNYETDYQFDVLGNLLMVTQNGSAGGSARTRTFTYDSLSRLVCAANPEVQAVTCPSSAQGTFPPGAVTYSYDANGNLATKTAPAPNQQSASATVSITFSYDALNRLTKKTYAGMTMPTILFGYDGSSTTSCSPPQLTDMYPLGRRTFMCDGSGATSWTHDKMGRIASQSQTQVTSSNTSVTESLSYLYNLNGSVQSITYPSTRTISYAYAPPQGSTSAGRTISAIDSTGPINYLTQATYAPPGELAGALYGKTTSFAGITGSNGYNNRLQPAFLSAANPTQTIFSLSYGFNSGSNNGSISQIVNNLDSTRSRQFTYDSLSRISQANTTVITGANCWGEVYTIDAWGNLTNIAGPSGMTGCKTEGWNSPVNPNNQITGWCYDAVGNLLDKGTCADQAHSYVYDAEGQLQSPPAQNPTTGQLTYTYYYNGDGNRVQKCNANPCTSASTSGTLYWRASGGEVLDESDRSGNMQEEYVYFNGQRAARRDVVPNNVHYYFLDHLNSTSVITDSNGNVQQQTDYFPYGGVAYSTGLDPAHYKFTGKERDAESGLDNFGARYHASTMGRFMSPDPKMPSLKHLVNPQKWNKYAYTVNNPIRYFDPDGLEEMDVQMRAVIQAQSVGDPLGRRFAGDNRGFTSAQNVTSRTSITVRIETDASKRPGNPIISVTQPPAGHTNQIDANGNVIKTGQQTQGLPTVTGSRDANGNAVLNFQQNAQNPLEPQSITPAIRTDLNVTVNQAGTSVTTVGTVSGSPSFELNVGTEGGSITNIPLQTEPSGDTNFGLGHFQTNSILNVTPLPPPPPACAQDKERSCSQ